MAWVPGRHRPKQKRGSSAHPKSSKRVSALPLSRYLWIGLLCCSPAFIAAYIALFLPTQPKFSGSDTVDQVSTAADRPVVEDASRADRVEHSLSNSAPVRPDELVFNSGLLVEDRANILDADLVSRLDSLLKAVEDSTTNQIGVLTISSLGGVSIEDWSIRAARKWALGQAKKDNGILLLIAVDDRRLRIEVGRGLEATLTDLQCHRIIEEVMVPRMQAGRRNAAVVDGIDAILAIVSIQFRTSHSAWYEHLDNENVEVSPSREFRSTISPSDPARNDDSEERRTHPVEGAAFLLLVVVLMLTGWHLVAKSNYKWLFVPFGVVALFSLYSWVLAIGSILVSLLCLIAMSVAIHGKRDSGAYTVRISTSPTTGNRTRSSSGGGGRFGGGGASGRW